MVASNATDERDLRIVAATLAGTLVACLFYGIDRTWAAWTSAPFDPDTVPATLRIDYFWRLSLAAFLGTTAAALAFLATEGRARRVTVRLGPLLLPALLFASLISVLWP